MNIKFFLRSDQNILYIVVEPKINKICIENIVKQIFILNKITSCVKFIVMLKTCEKIC